MKMKVSNTLKATIVIVTSLVISFVLGMQYKTYQSKKSMNALYEDMMKDAPDYANTKTVRDPTAEDIDMPFPE